MSVRMTLEEGEALVHVGRDGKLTTVVDLDDGEWSDGELLVAGFEMCLEDEKWRAGLIEKTRKRLSGRDGTDHGLTRRQARMMKGGEA